MNARCAWMVGLILVCSSSLADPQQLPSHGASRRVQTLERQTALERDPSAPPRYTRADLARQANELSQLGQSISSDIQQAKPADLSRKLKRINKLSRELRREIVP